MGAQAMYGCACLREYPKEILIQIFVKPSVALTNSKLSLKKHSLVKELWKYNQKVYPTTIIMRLSYHETSIPGHELL